MGSASAADRKALPGILHAEPERLSLAGSAAVNRSRGHVVEDSESVADVLTGGVSARFLPDGLDYHVCFGSEGNLHVSEIWDSREQLAAFGERLMPILAAAGIEFSGEPEIFEAHNIIKR
jgi:hypothetical protein